MQAWLKMKWSDNNGAEAFDRTCGLTLLEDDQCKATKLGPDGQTGD